MKTDVEVLDEAIATLDTEGMWCQGSWFRQGGSMGDGGKIIGMCAEGAIRFASGYFTQTMNTFGVRVLTPTTGTDELADQVYRIERTVSHQMAKLVGANCALALSTLNDRHTTTASDVILAMKHAREELS